MIFDIIIYNFFSSLDKENTIFLFKLITFFGGTVAITFFSILILSILYRKKNKTKFYFFLSSIIFGNIILHTLKLLIQRLRPEEKLIEISTYSFPSGHAMMSLILSYAFFIVFKNKIKSKVTYSLIILYPILIGFSRIYLNVHWFSDVIFGWLFGLSLVSIFRRIFKL